MVASLTKTCSSFFVDNRQQKRQTSGSCSYGDLKPVTIDQGGGTTAVPFSDDSSSQESDRSIETRIRSL